MRVRTPLLALLGIAGFVGCVVQADPAPSGRPNPNAQAGGSTASGGATSNVSGATASGGTGQPGAGGATPPGAGGASPPGAGGTPPGAGGTGDPGAGGTGDPGAGGSAGSPVVQCGAPSPDPNCTTSLAKTDATCTVDCCVACGFNALGTKTCSCNGTTFTACPCAKPTDWTGGATAEACTMVIGNDGLVETNDETPCDTHPQGTQCIAADPPSGTTSRGCVCLPDPEAGGALQWSCGSTNKWFTCPTGATHSGCPPPA